MKQLGSAEPEVQDFRQIDVAHHRAELDQRGFTIIENLMPPGLLEYVEQVIQRLRAQIPPQESNTFRGATNERIGNLLALDPIFQQVALCPPLLELALHFLGPEYQLSALTTIALGGGATAQGSIATISTCASGSHDRSRP